MSLRLTKKIILKGKIKAETGLRVGTGRESIEIGGIDLAVVKLPDGTPYIPGSSIKGKMRSLMERNQLDLSPVKQYWERARDRKKELKNLKEELRRKGIKKPEEDSEYKERKKELDKVDANDIKELLEKNGWRKMQSVIIHCCEQPICSICLVFGRPSEMEINQPTRLYVRDAHLIEKEFEKLYEDLARDGLYTEIKQENVIDRLTSAANPRKIERVPKGALFKFQLIYNVFDEEDENRFNEVVLKALRLLEDDYIGGMGSRGYGKIKFEDLKRADMTIEDYKSGKEPDFKEFSLRA